MDTLNSSMVCTNCDVQEGEIKDWMRVIVMEIGPN